MKRCINAAKPLAQERAQLYALKPSEVPLPVSRKISKASTKLDEARRALARNILAIMIQIGD